MPPKVKITKNDIIGAALELVRAEGADALNARRIAMSLGCSTQPIFSNFSSMEELDDAVTKAAHEHYLGFLKKEAEKGEFSPYKSFGMAYMRFAKEEKELFKLLFMCDRGGKAIPPTADFEASVQMITDSCGLSREKATLMHLEMWVAVHGIGTMLATSFLELDWDVISTITTDIYQGVRARHMSEEGK
ncbi:MAG: TetR/AcrR family transcriptional regulator [Ruminococcaceae bacterium]|nr:TetR/AcrR family transcriptional regulator [Oscillospiraceae bacterium]